MRDSSSDLTNNRLIAIIRSIVPGFLRRNLVRATRRPPVGRVDFHNLRRLTPISRSWGGDRGLPIDRYYIEQFLYNHRGDIQGRVLEIGNDLYTKKFGSKRVLQNDVLDIDANNPKATIVSNLVEGDTFSPENFDCIICTQTLQQIFDIQAAFQTLQRILKPDGVLLATFPGISQIDRYAMDIWGDYWRFTALSAKEMLLEAFPSSMVTIQTFGNVLSAVAFLHGLASEELSGEELDFNDKDYQVLIAVRAIKSGVV